MRQVVTGCVIGLVVGCGGQVGEQATEDVGADTAVRVDSVVFYDTTPWPETPPDPPPRRDTAPPICDQPVASAFTCEPPTVSDKGGPPTNACSESDLQDLVTQCIDVDYKVIATCQEKWKDTHPACDACVTSFAFDAAIIPGRVYPDRDKCFYWVLDAGCAKAMRCMLACDGAVCADCDRTAGSGTAGIDSEFDECITRERKRGGTTSPKGACYDLAAKDGLDCFAAKSEALGPCIVDEFFAPTGPGGHPNLDKMRAGILRYYRGACRDGGDWSKSSTP